MYIVPMKNLVSQSLKFFTACNILLAVVAGNGLHVHLLIDHAHGSAPMHHHDVFVHAHEDAAEPLMPPSLESNSEHRHFVAKLQITGVQQSSSQFASLSVAQLEPWIFPASARALAVDTSFWIVFTDSSPPLTQVFTENLSGRSPPLA